ncbi:MAG: methionine adenosyltransferase [Nitrosopumilaceae archaeon]|jgi:S-adenosylmethionine synthetase|uniref:Methionine adenosyltransferase n=2 Tax=Candidatus Nitrosomaritimum aestuariumsis TaxID=3342354 RepID=A0AC60W8E6_9ARCH|nr:methionine adenosyltransferase [Nitrosopumilaceae archaeon]MBA4461356.1 methionine adenosyltransferase [Nitrosopumilaceae archaeon]MBA4463368.1 methionine adenosyltransferase [Nitrosopumilaceae archaeon]NCF21798.1 methionine adenosyltransferase [Nitrosopumilaceae archaeon]
MTNNFLFTSESVTEGHPDKICDQISDAFLDEYLRQDPDSRVAVETLVTTDFVAVVGEVTSKANFEKSAQEQLVRKTIREIGYNNKDLMFDTESCEVNLRLHAQSPDISQGVTATAEKEQGAGDQGLMFGFATNETDELMPMPILLSQKLAQQLAKVRKDNTLSWVRPDGKTQVSVRYENNKPTKIETIVVSTQHAPEISQEEITKEMIDKVIKPVLGDLWNDDIVIHVNPTGKFVIGGPHGDAGLTGRKIIVDTYGGFGRHGGGAFSGKDPSKVDRSACYMCRYIAKNIVAAELAERCEVQLAYAIGVAEPVSLYVNTFGTNKIPEEKIEELVRENFDMKPSGIISTLDLKRPIYKKTAAYGHFGRNEPEFNWEKTDKVDSLKQSS